MRTGSEFPWLICRVLALSLALAVAPVLAPGGIATARAPARDQGPMVRCDRAREDCLEASARVSGLGCMGGRVEQAEAPTDRR